MNRYHIKLLLETPTAQQYIIEDVQTTLISVQG